MLRALWVRLRGLVGDVDSIEEEVRLHLDREIERHVARGMTIEDARAEARRAFGNFASHQEAARETWRWRWIEHAWQDLRYAARVLRRDRVFTVTTVVSIGVGIGAVTTVYGVANKVLLSDLPVPHPEQLVTLSEHYPGRTRDQFPYDMYKALRDAPGLFADLAAVNVYDRSNVSVSGPSGRTSNERARVAIVSGNYFRTLRVSPALGRTLSEDDDQTLGGHPVAVISDRYWSARTGRSADILGRTIAFNGTTYRIVGVMPRGFAGEWIGRPVDIWVSFAMHQQVLVEVPAPLLKRNDSFLRLVGRLQPGSTIARAAPIAHGVYQRTMAEWLGHPLTDEDRRRLAQWRLELTSDRHGYLPQRDDLAPIMRVLGLIVILALIIAAANTVGLLLARSASRTRELAVRRAIGAGSSRLARQLLVEGFLLAGLGGAVGIALAAWGGAALARSLAAGPVLMFWGSSSWIAFESGLDAGAIGMAIRISVATGVIFGIAPMLIRPIGALTPTLSARGATSSLSPGQSRLAMGKTLVVAQLAISLVVVAAAGLFVRTLMNLRATPLGFDREGVLLVWTQPSAIAHSPVELRQVWSAATERVRSVPGVVAVGASNQGILNGFIPVAGMSSNPMFVPGQAPRPTTISGLRAFLTPGYFSAMGMHLLAGRDFTDADADTLHRVVILNRTLARHYFGESDPIGRLVAFPPDTVANTSIIGVVSDATEGTPRAVEARQMRSFFSYRDRESRRRLDAMMIAVRTRGDPHAIAGPVREAIRGVTPLLPVLEINTVDEQLGVVLAPERLIARIAAIFAAIALLLSCVGLYGLVAFLTVRRTSEIGIRIALGASRATILEMVLADGLKLVGLGILVGLIGALSSSRLIASRLYGIETGDPGTIAIACTLLVAVAAIAGYLPARRAAMVDPMTALRCE